MSSRSVCDSPADLQDEWPVGDPARYGLDPVILQEMRQRITAGSLDNVHAVLIARDGVLVYEQYRAGPDQNGMATASHVSFDAMTRHNGNSMTKSVTGLLVGIAIRRGWIDGLDASVLSYFPEYEDIHAPEKRRITLRNLLTMSDGLEWFEFVSPHDSMKRMFNAPDPYRYILERDPVMPPGRTFNYNSGATELLAAILHKGTGKTVDVLAREALFDPLGITDVEWNGTLRNGNPMACSALRARPRDWAKLGQLVLDHGIWKGSEIVPSAWIADSMSAQNNGPAQFLYGFHWWLGRSFHHGAVLPWAGAMGWAGQRLIVVPAVKMVVLVNAWLPDRMNLPEHILLNQYILPAIASA